MWRQLARVLGLLVLSALALQLYFLARVGLMAVVDPQSTTFQRSEIRRLISEQHQVLWSQQWVSEEHISDSLKRAVTSTISNVHGIAVADVVPVAPGSIPVTTSGKLRRQSSVDLYQRKQFARLDV